MGKKFLDILPEFSLSQVRFKVYSPEQIRKKSVVQITSPHTYNQSGIAIPHGVMDSRMGVIQPYQTCQTCGGDYISCLGHTGHIELADPVVHIEYAETVLKILNNVCYKCSAVLESSVCHECNHISKPVKLIKPNLYYIEDTRISATKIREIFEKIKTPSLLGLHIRPEWLILTVLPVPSVKTRPTIFLQSGVKAEDDLTHKLIDIVKTNQKLKRSKELVEISAIYETLYSLLNYNITTYFNNTVSGVPVAMSRNKVIKSLIERIKGKTGRFRHNLAGKRVNYVARSVVTPAPDITIDKIKIPELFAQELTRPIVVNLRNIDHLKKLILNHPKYPTVLYITDLQGYRLKVLEFNKEIILGKLEPGFICERQLLENDTVIVNRQPTLHKLSMMVHKVQITKSKTIGLNPCVCPPYNADFDGDEMNIHVLQNTIAQAESRFLMGVENNIISSKHGKPSIGMIKDATMGLFLITYVSNTYSWSDLTYLLSDIKIQNYEHYSKLGKQISGKDILSLLLHQDFDFYHKTNNKDPLIIKNGVLLQGHLDKHSIGDTGTLLERYCKRYGTLQGSKLIDRLLQTSMKILNRIGFTYSYRDNIINEDSKLKISKIIKQYQGKLKLLAEQEQTTEIKHNKLKLLNQLRDTAGKITLSKTKTVNPVLLMAESGSSGSQLNFIQVTANLGLQSYSDKRNNHAYGDNRVYSLEIKDILQNHNYIRSSYSTGLDSHEFFEQACAARESEIDVYVKTATSGYLQRRMINCMNDIYIGSDNTVRDSYDKIVQYKCGKNNVDFRKIEIEKPMVDLDLLDILPRKKTQIKSIETAALEQFCVNLSPALKLLPEILKTGIATFSLTYNYTPQQINSVENKIIEKMGYYEYDSFEPIGIVSAQSIGQPATQMTLKSLHVSGVAELKLTSGLERLIELVNATTKIKTPAMTFYVNTDSVSTKNEILGRIANITVSEICKIDVDLDDLSLTVVYKPNTLQITYSSVYNNIKSKIAGVEIQQLQDSRILLRPKTNSYFELNRIHVAVKKLKLSGISKLNDIIVVKTHTGYKIKTQGSNLKQTRMLFNETSSVEFESNDIMEILTLYGLETARFYLVKEIYNVLKKQGLTVSLTHLNLLADTMTLYGTISPVGRTGIIKHKKSTIAKAAFETASSFIIDASLRAESDKLKGVFENSLLGKNINVGTQRIKLKYERSANKN